MGEYIPSPAQWVREQVELYEGSGGTEGLTLRDTGLPVIVVTHVGNKTGAIRKTPLMRVVDGTATCCGSPGRRASSPVWVYNLRAKPGGTIRDPTSCMGDAAREVGRTRSGRGLWPGVGAYRLTPTTEQKRPYTGISRRTG